MNWYIALFIGYVMGVVFALLVTSMKKPDGVFQINLLDPMDETLKLELLRPLAEVMNEKYIRFRVITVKDESREKQ